MPTNTSTGSSQETILLRLRAMGIDAQLMQGGRCVLARLRLQRRTFETTASPIAIDEVLFSTVGRDKAKCLRPRALFQLPILRILDCRDATAIEARIHLAWQRHVGRIRDTEAWLRRLGTDVRADEERAVVSFPLEGEDPASRARMIDPHRVILPSRGLLSGVALDRSDDRILRIDPAIESAIDLEMAVSTRLEELARLEHRLAEQRRREVAGSQHPVRPVGRAERNPHLLLVGPQMIQQRKCIESLRVRGYRVQAVSSEREAIAAFNLHSPQLVLADVALGRSDGIDLITSLRHVPGIEEVPVILVDTRRRPDRREVARRLGAAGYLVYPIEVGQIADRLTRIVNEPRRRRFTRYPQKISVDLEGSAKPYVATAIGRGGMFLTTDDPVPTNEYRRCRIALPEVGAKLGVQSEVLYRARTARSARQGVGLRFHAFEDAGERVLIDYLRTLQPEPPPPGL